MGGGRVSRKILPKNDDVIYEQPFTNYHHHHYHQRPRNCNAIELQLFFLNWTPPRDTGDADSLPRAYSWRWENNGDDLIMQLVHHLLLLLLLSTCLFQIFERYHAGVRFSETVNYGKDISS